MQPTLTWIHLSDRHIRTLTASDSRSLDDALVSDLKNLLTQNGLKPDILFFTGDLIFGRDQRHPEDTVSMQFKKGAAFLDRIRLALPDHPIPKSKVFIVPGNHDVNRAFVSKPDQEYLLFPKRTKDEIDALFDTGNYEHDGYFRRLQDYKSFLHENQYHHCCTDSDRLVYASQIETDQLSVGIVGMNSAWPCGSDAATNGGLYISARKQLDYLLPFVEKSDCRFVLIHHPEAWYAESERNDLWRHLILPKFHFCLHGHEHQVWYTEHQDHITFAAGASYDRSDKPASYSVTSLDLTTRRIRHWIRAYSTENGGGWVFRGIPNRKYINEALELDIPRSIRPSSRKVVINPRSRIVQSKNANEGRPRYRLVVFDLDGTLVEMKGTEYSWAMFWREFKFRKEFRIHGLQLFDRRIIDYQEWCNYCSYAYRLKNANRDRFEQIIRKNCKLRPNTLEVLQELHANNVKLAVISGGVNVVFETMFEPSVRELFCDVFINTMEFDADGTLIRIKASPYDFRDKLTGVQELCEKYSISPDDVAFVGDAPNDRFVAKYVGKLIAVSSSRNRALALDADKVLNGHSLKPLLKIILGKKKTGRSAISS